MNAAGRQPPQRGRFRIDRYLVDPQRNRITGPDGTIAVQPKVMDVLCRLAERQGDVVSRTELIDRVWGVEFGGDESLTRAISQLRKALPDGRAEPRIVETIAKRGYRLTVPVLPAEAEGVGGGPIRGRRRRLGLLIAVAAMLLGAAALLLWLTRPDPVPARAVRTGIVVIAEPFGTDEGAPGADRLAEELSTAVARNPLIRTRLAGDAPDLSEPMQYVLRGHVRRIDSRIRVSTQLLDAATGEVVWGEAYDRPFDPQFSQRDAVVRTIASELQLPLLRAVKRKLLDRPVLELVPWELTLLVTWVPGDEVRPAGPPSEDSYWLQRRALEIDPDYAPAHALFAQLASYHPFFHPPSASDRERARARRHADRAIELAPYDAEVLYQVALFYRNAGERDRARALLERVIQLHPTHPLAAIDLAHVQGQCEPEAGAAIQRLQAIGLGMSSSNPARWVVLSHLSALHLGQGDFTLARDTARQARAIVPVTWSAMPLAAADAELGLAGEAAAVLAEHRREWPAFDPHHFAERMTPLWCLHGSRTDEVQASFRRLAAMVAPRP